MMRKVLLGISFMLLVFALPAQAALDSSHHDLPIYDGTTSQNCFKCHGIIRTTTQTVANAGSVGTFCLQRCHIAGVGLVSDTNVTPLAPSYFDNAGTFVTPATAVESIVQFNRSHGSAMSAQNPGGGFPYSPAAQTTGDLECTSCHAVHDNRNSPFSWKPLMAETAGGGLCDTCHTPYAGTSAGSAWTNVAPTGNHPVNFRVSTAGALGRSTGVSALGNTRSRRLISIDQFTAPGIFDVATPSGTALTGSAAATGSWITGGHMYNTADNSYARYNDTNSILGCATCHSAHAPNNAANGGGLNNLVLMQTDRKTEGWNPVCMGCHGGATTWAANATDWNVGGSGYGHPVGANTDGGTSKNSYLVSTGQFTFAIATSPPAAMSFGDNGEVMCSSCHYVHRPGATKSTIANTMLILDAGQTTAAICKSCHTGVGLPDVSDRNVGGAGESVNAHHRTRVGSFAAGSIVPGGGAGTPAELSMVIKDPSWRNTTTRIGDFSTGMDCADCHTFGTAHNW